MQRLSVPVVAIARQVINARFALLPLSGNLNTNKIYAPMHPAHWHIEFFDPRLPNLQQPSINSIPHVPRGKLIPILEQHFPLWHLNITLPAFGTHPAPEIRADGGRNLTHRRKSMKKHWRRKYFIRDIVVYKKREKKRKLAAEKVFRDRLMAKIHSAQAFDAKSYVENFLSKVDWKSSTTPAPVSALITDDDGLGVAETAKAAPNKRKTSKTSKHWTDVISVEQLFGLPPSTYIDKTAGVADDDEWQEIVKQRQKYDDTFRKRTPQPQPQRKSADDDKN